MGTVGDAYDNALCESFFATLEWLLRRRKLQTRAEARMALFTFIEGWYTPSRRHSAFGYKSPIEFKRIVRNDLATGSPEPSAKPGELQPVRSADRESGGAEGRSLNQVDVCRSIWQLKLVLETVKQATGRFYKDRFGDLRSDRTSPQTTKTRKPMHAETFFAEARQICSQIDIDKVEELADSLLALRQAGGRLFVLGAGGSAGNASHAVNDFRKLCGIEAYAPTDNVSELTARTNDEGWATVFTGWLEISRLNSTDALLVYSVGGGDAERNVSVNIVQAIDLAKARGAKVFGVVGRATGHTAKNGDVVVVVPSVNPDRVTPLSEAFQAVVWHCLVSNPKLQQCATKW